MSETKGRASYMNRTVKGMRGHSSHSHPNQFIILLLPLLLEKKKLRPDAMQEEWKRGGGVGGSWERKTGGNCGNFLAIKIPKGGRIVGENISRKVRPMPGFSLVTVWPRGKRGEGGS